MDIKYPIKTKYMKCVLQINGFSGPCPRVQSNRRVGSGQGGGGGGLDILGLAEVAHNALNASIYRFSNDGSYFKAEIVDLQKLWPNWLLYHDLENHVAT